MTDLDRHLDDIGAIRAMMERASKFLSLSGLSGVSAGLVALAGLWVADRILAEGAGAPAGRVTAYLVLDAVLVLLLSLGLALHFSRRLARQKGIPLWGSAAKYVALALAGPLLAGGALCVILAAHALAWLIPSCTLVFYGLALLNAGNFTFGEIRYLGALQVVLGLGAAAIPGSALIFWGVGFGVGHILYGLLLFRKYEQ
jgi:hypothetical protein